MNKVLACLPAYPDKKAAFIILDEKSFETLPFDTKTRVFCPPCTFKSFQQPLEGCLSNPILYAIGHMAIENKKEIENPPKEWETYFKEAATWIENNKIEYSENPPDDGILMMVYVPKYQNDS